MPRQTRQQKIDASKQAILDKFQSLLKENYFKNMSQGYEVAMTLIYDKIKDGSLKTIDDVQKFTEKSAKIGLKFVDKKN